MNKAIVGLVIFTLACRVQAGDRYQIIPQADHQIVLVIDGVEQTRWHPGKSYPRPFFFPIRGASGKSLTRMGHPGAPNHDHHRSVWFAHHDVNGLNFWSDETETVIQQREWMCYQDGQDEGAFAVLLDWLDKPQGTVLLEQELIAAFYAGEEDSWFLELQSTFRPRGDEVTLGKTNFGFLAVRMSKQISGYFGGGTIANSDGETGEKAIFGKPSTWMDYRNGEGITYFDHPDNRSFPSKWHVREDGWMGASVFRDDGMVLQKNESLVVRYLLWMGKGGDLEAIAKMFAQRPGLTVQKAKRPHVKYEILRTN
jgi:hypothetical protein